MSDFGINDPIIQPAPQRGPAPSFGLDDPIDTPAPAAVAAPRIDPIALGDAVDEASRTWERDSNVAYNRTDEQRAASRQRFIDLDDQAKAAGVTWKHGQAEERQRATFRADYERRLDDGDRAAGDPGRTRRTNALIDAGGNDFVPMPEKQAPGAKALLDEQHAWFADPANVGKTPPARIMQVAESREGGRIRVSPRFGRMLLTNLETMVGTPNVAEPGIIEDLAFGNSRQVSEDQLARSQRLNAMGGTPYELLAQAGVGPEGMRQYDEQLTAAGGTNLGIPEGAFNAFVRGSNQLGADLVGGGGDMIADVTGSQTARDVAGSVRTNLEGVAAQYPGSASVVGKIDPTSLRWWTENLAGQAPNFAAMAAPGMGVGRVLSTMGATQRAAAIAQGVTSFSSAAAFEATSAYQDIYSRLRQSGANEEDARALALTESATVGVINGALERVSFGELFMKNHEAMSLLQRGVRGMIAEGGTEAIQEYVPMAVGQLMESGQLKGLDRAQVSQIISSGLIGAAMGGGTEIAQGATGHGSGQPAFNDPQGAASDQGPDLANMPTPNMPQQVTATRVGGQETPGANPVEIIPTQPTGALALPAPAPIETAPESVTPPRMSPGESVAAEADPFANPTFEDAAPVDDAAVQTVIERLAAQRAAQAAAGGAPAVEVPQTAPTAPEPDPDFSLATFEDAAPVDDPAIQDVLAGRQQGQDASGGSQAIRMPFETGDTSGATFRSPRDARLAATMLAKKSNRPVYITPDREGGFSIDRRRPAQDNLIAIMPDGTGSATTLRRVDDGNRRRAGEAAPGAEGRIDTANQLGMFATNPDGSPMVVGERPGQVTMFGDVPGSKPKPRAPTKEELLAEERAKATTPMFGESEDVGKLGTDGRLNKQSTGSPQPAAGSTSSTSAAGTAGEGTATTEIERRRQARAKVANDEGDQSVSVERPGVAPAERPGAVSRAPGTRDEQQPPDRGASRRTPGAANPPVVGEVPEPRRAGGARGEGDARGGDGNPAPGRKAGPDERAPTGSTRKGAQGVPRREGEQASQGVEPNYRRRVILDALRGELRSEIDRRQGEIEEVLGHYARPYTFPKGIPTELRMELEGHPLRKQIRSMLSTDVAGGEGNDALTDLGAERYVQALEYLAGSPLNHALAAAREGTPRQQFLAALVDAQPRTKAELPTMEHVLADKLPTGTTFEAMGYPLKIVEPDEGERYISGDAFPRDLPVAMLGTIPIDVGSLKPPPDLDVSLVEFNSSVRPLDREAAVSAPPANETTIQRLARERSEKARPARPRVRPRDVVNPGYGSPSKPPAGRIRVAPLPGGQPKKIRAMLDDFAGDLGHRIRQHAKARAGTGGTYFPGSQRTQIKRSGDLDVGAHELSHYIDDTYGVIKAWAGGTGNAAPFDGELTPAFSQWGSSPPASAPQVLQDEYTRGEGVAEWFRAYVMNPQAAAAAAPIFYAHVRTQVPANVWAAIDAYSNEVRKWAGATGVAQVLSNVNDQLTPAKRTTMEKLKEALTGDAIRTELLDDKWPIVKAIIEARELRGDIEPIRTRDDPETLMRLFQGEEQAIQDAIENGVPRAFNVGRRAKGVNGGITWTMEPLAANAKDSSIASIEEATREGIAFLVSKRVITKAATWREETAIEIADRTALLEDSRDEAIDNRTKEIERIRDAMIGRLLAGDPGYAARVGRITADAAKDVAQMTAVLHARAAKAIARMAKKLTSKVEQKIERMAGIGAGIKNDEDVAGKALLELARDPKKLANLEEFGRRYNAQARGLLQYMLAKGRLSRESFRTIIAKNTFYTDLHRIVDDQQKERGFTRPPLGKALGTSKTVIHTMKGSTLEIGNPIVNLMNQVAEVMHETDKAYVIERFARLLTKVRGMHDGDAIDFDAIGSEAQRGDKDVTKFWRRGEEKFMQFRPDVKAALDSIGMAPELGFALRAVSTLIKGLPQAGITKSPAFVVRQLFKDSIQRGMISRTGSGLKESFGFFTGEEKQRLARTGGMQAGLYTYDAGWEGRQAQAIRELAKRPNTTVLDPRRLLHAANPATWWAGYEKATAYLGDTRTRLAEARKAMEAGTRAIELRADETKELAAATSPAQVDAIRARYAAQIEKLGGKALLGVRDRYDAALYAASQARSLIDYAVKGKTIRRLEPYLMFVNPSIQGPRRTLRAMRETPAVFAKRYGALILLPALLAAMARWLGGDEEEYNQLPNWQRRFFLNFKVGGRWVAIPQPYELAVPRAALESLVAKQRGDSKAFEGLGEAAGGSLMPFQIEMPFGGILRGFAENSANWRFFFERSIVPTWEVNKDNDLRDASSASRLGKGISKLADVVNAITEPVAGVDARVDPRYMDNMVYNIAGGLGALAMNLSNLGREDRPMNPIDLLSGITRPTPSYQARDVQAVEQLAQRLGIERSKEITELRDLLKLADQAPTIIEKNRAAARAREYASQLRADLEARSATLLDEGRAKVEDRRAARGTK